MEKNEIYEGSVVSVRFPDKGIVCTPEGNVTVKNTLPGQTVSFILTKKKNGRMEGRLKEVIKRAPEEIDSPCPHFGECGGCRYQNLPYEAELALKDRLIRDVLDPVIKNDYIYEGLTPSPEDTEYRNKMEFSFGNECLGGPLTLGMHRAGRFNDVITVDKCRIMDGDFRTILNETHRFFSERNISFYRKHDEEGFLRHLLLRKGKKTGEILLLIETTSQSDFDMKTYARMLLSLELEGSFAGILHLINDDSGDSVKGNDIKVLYGRDYFYDEVLSLRFKITPFSFFQTNTLGAEVLYGKAREYALSTLKGGKPVIFDLYSGTGTIGQIMSEAAGKVIGIELVPEAVEAAKENAAYNKLDNTDFIAGDVLKELDRIEDRPDLIILDPPRDGCAPKALSKILDYGVENIIYISCKITSLARDLVPIQEAGYRVVKAAAVDMFPNTSGVETVVLLSKGEVDSKKIRVEFSLEDMDMSEFQDGATYTQIKDYVLEHSGLKVSNLYISQIKRKCGIEVGKNYNLPKSEDSRQPLCPPEKEKAIREAFKYFGII